MWHLEAREGGAWAIAAAAYVAAVVAFLLLQEIGLRLRRVEHRRWWAGNGRDLLNLAGLAAIAGSLRMLGLSSAAALLVGGTLTLVLFGASVFVGTQTSTAHPRAWSLALGLVIALPVLGWTPQVVGVFAGVAEALFRLPPR